MDVLTSRLLVQETNEIGHGEAYRALSRILEVL